MTNLNQAAAPGTGSVPVVNATANGGNPAVFQLLTAALSALNGVGNSDPTTVALLSAALSALTVPSAAINSGNPVPHQGTVSIAAPAPASPPTVAVVSTATTATVPAPSVLRTSGPWVVEGLYLVVPTGPLTAIVDDGAEHLWYCITKGRYVGVTTVNALAIAAVSGVSSGSMISHKTQALAVGSFNSLLSLGLIEIR